MQNIHVLLQIYFLSPREKLLFHSLYLCFYGRVTFLVLESFLSQLMGKTHFLYSYFKLHTKHEVVEIRLENDVLHVRIEM